MDFQAQLDQAQEQLIDLYDSAVVYFEGLGTYGLVGWVLVVLGVCLAFAGSVLLAL